VGNFTGAGQPISARTAARVGIVSGFMIACVWATALYASRDWLPIIFTAEPTVTNLITATMLPLAFFQLPYSINAVAGGVFRGLGQQRRGGIINTFAFYVIGLPIGYWLAFSCTWYLYGLWSGLVIALMAACILSLTSVMIANWQHHIDVAAERLATDQANELAFARSHESDPLLPLHTTKAS
jgi:MATE family multidrug resistance protein